jgi:hypothetical protein
VFRLQKFLYLFKDKNVYSFMIFMATENGRTKKFSPFSFGAVVGSGVPMDKIRIRDKHPGSATQNTAQVMGSS